MASGRPRVQCGEERGERNERPVYPFHAHAWRPPHHLTSHHHTSTQLRRDALILVQARTGVKDYTDDEQRLLSTLDLDLERQAGGGSLAQLAQEKGGGNIEVLINPRQTEPREEAGRALLDSIE